MFNLFKRKEMNQEAATLFWEWFGQHEEDIISQLKTDMMSVIFTMDDKLKPVFPYLKSELEFEIGFNDGKGEFFFFHMDHPQLKKDAQRFKEMMPEALKNRWEMSIDA